MKDLSGRLKDLRLARDLSLRQLAEESGINYNVLHKWETGKASPNRSNVLRLAEVFNVKPSWLLFGKDADVTKGLSVDDDISVLSEESQQQIKSLIKHLIGIESRRGEKNGSEPQQ